MIESVLAVLIMGFAFDIPSAQSPINPKLQNWVVSLGDKNYRVREMAASELINAGPAAIPTVRAGTTSTDHETAERCQRLIQAIHVADIYRKTDLLVKRPGEPAPKGLPGFERFIAITGDTREARELYVEMLHNHREIVESFDRDRLEAGEIMSNFLENIWEQALEKRFLYPIRPWPPDCFDYRSEAVLLLFYLSDRRFYQNTISGYEPWILTSQLVQNLVCGPELVPTVRKMFINWYQNEKRMEFVAVTSKVAANGEMRELLPTMLRWLGDKNADAKGKGFLLTQVARLGDEKLIEQIEPLLLHEAVVFQRKLKDRGDNLRFVETKLGDVALRVCCKWANQEMAILGSLVRFEDDCGKIPSEFLENCAFTEDITRREAYAKWRKLRAKSAMTAQKATTQKLAF